MKTKYFAGVFGIFLLMVANISPSWADPAHLVVVRSPNGQLYKMTCNGTSCSAWAPISGIFNQQPTLTWDEGAEKYYLYGVGGDGFTIWRSSFDRAGNHNADWAALPGGSPSPVAAAAGEVLYLSWQRLRDALGCDTKGFCDDRGVQWRFRHGDPDVCPHTFGP